jgi:hypothetical protein
MRILFLDWMRFLFPGPQRRGTGGTLEWMRILFLDWMRFLLRVGPQD